jgi:hypothetical protein
VGGTSFSPALRCSVMDSDMPPFSGVGQRSHR